MALPNARNQYLKTQIETASKEQLVVMLFDGIIRFTENARKAIEEKSVEDSHHNLMRAQAIIMELICTVDKEKGGDIANNLLSLHAYAFNCLIVCNMKKDVTQIDEVQKIYRELREAWVGAMDSLGISSNAGKPLPVAPAQPVANAAPVAAGVAKPALNVAAKPAAPAAPAQAATGYGMGRTAMLGAFGAPKAAPSAPVQPAAPAAPSASANVNIAASVANTNSAKQNAMMNAYSNGSRSIA